MAEHTQSGGTRVAVLGATGNVGTSLVEALSHDPEIAEVRALSRREATWSSPKVQWIGTDACTDDLVSRFRGLDTVVHLEWIFQPTHNPATTWRNNVHGSLRVFDAVAEAGVRNLVYASSVGAYSPGPKTRAVDEQWPTHGWPAAAYTREKAYVERCLDSFEQQHPDLRITRLRPGFIFKHESASQQRRLFAGPLLPERLAHPELLPAIPDMPGLRFQALHTADAAEAYRLAVHTPVRGAVNIAADPIIDGPQLAELFGTRTVRIPSAPVRAALAGAWTLHLVPASPQLFDAVLHLPIMDTTRARTELGWTPRYSSTEAISAFVEGLRHHGGADTPPLAPEIPGGRVQELKTGVGERQ
ncbi:nucleoside-diphosphate-sugar epimerase [Halopolyspora algeriensis]|uniref:Nucleoside-diphosphate-sugar epimerase n=1 Tax=Halopolyspora algeriensis TaxID=1500506 RepID=A0A368VSC8_9ACTN|nr:NAD-dependent epimerase/dehydratase family protein [Halopolyspora algeriensis]RCW44609.1 nucleoside-diphosphate-sugar epimerase [Halopolyspora algeriensis]TQM55970.1 nucleoside-diphosphate-sugar epimerase [Halopolyspora algeriensis]